MASLAGVLPLENPNAIGSALTSFSPSWHHLLGTDELGRDLLSRVIYGARVSLLVGFGSTALALVVGGPLGLVAGYAGGWVAGVIDTAGTAMLAFPALVLAMVAIAVLGPNPATVIVILGVLAIAPLARVIRINTSAVATRNYVLAARASGASGTRIVVREIMPNVSPQILAYCLVSVAVLIVAEGSLSFLGLSVRPPTPTWGSMIAEGRLTLGKDPYVALWPSLALFGTVLALNSLAGHLRWPGRGSPTVAGVEP
ncbi:MAG: ABC transporter permease [Acidimicrobiales bacterium]